ncbi:MAG: shikimate dehydrogenase (NADP(+)) [Armatimonadota bacterium]|nr:MAG: shikimate dehydrogenase (NADP(+)) [Armatimonadota bacterium]
MSETALRLTGKTRVLAVFGCPVEHSLSPAMHNAAIRALGLDLVYVPFRVERDRLREAVAGVRALGFLGVNLTIPLKEQAVTLVDGLSPGAARVGSVNTLWWKDGSLMGESTDGPGFISSLEEAGGLPDTALVLGAGGSGRAICFALAERAVRIILANRTPERARKLAEELGDAQVRVIPMDAEALRGACREADLVVNCTSVGMSPNIGVSPLPPDTLRAGQTVYDLVYNPLETRLLADARAAGARAINGVRMLVHQGAYSFRLWTGVEPPLDVMEAAVIEGLEKGA